MGSAETPRSVFQRFARSVRPVAEVVACFRVFFFVLCSERTASAAVVKSDFDYIFFPRLVTALLR